MDNYVDFEDERNTSSIVSPEFIYNNPDATKALIMGIFKVVICIVGTLVDGLIIYIIMKYKNMQKPANIYIMNWLIADAMFVLVDPAEYHLVAMLKHFTVNASHICLFFSLSLIIRTLNVFFMLLMMFQWFFEDSAENLFDKHCHKLVLSVWASGIIGILVVTHSCLTTFYHSTIGDVGLALVVFVFTICLFVIHCKRRCTNPFSRNSSLSIALISSFCLCWSGLTIIMMFYAANKDSNVITWIYYVSSIVVYMYPLLCLYLFYKIDKKFAICWKLLFGYEDNQDEASTNFDEEEEINTTKITTRITNC